MEKTINCNGKLLNFQRPLIMGILNITPDSFYDGGRYTTEEKILQRTEQMLNDGVDIIDIGAYSSRPGAEDITPEEEKQRLIKALDIITANYKNLCISVDTFRAEIARFVVEKYKVSIINDIMGGKDPKMFETIANLGVPYILMHIQGTPQTMQLNPHYENLMQELILYFSKKLDTLRLLGIKDVIIDPGFGFGKTIEHNYQILKNLHYFEIFNLPILVGISRKSMIYKYLNSIPQEVLPGTLALNTIAILNGANILRVHDVKETKQIIDIVQYYKKI